VRWLASYRIKGCFIAWNWATILQDETQSLCLSVNRDPPLYIKKMYFLPFFIMCRKKMRFFCRSFSLTRQKNESQKFSINVNRENAWNGTNSILTKLNQLLWMIVFLRLFLKKKNLINVSINLRWCRYLKTFLCRFFSICRSFFCLSQILDLV